MQSSGDKSKERTTTQRCIDTTWEHMKQEQDNVAEAAVDKGAAAAASNAKTRETWRLNTGETKTNERQTQEHTQNTNAPPGDRQMSQGGEKQRMMSG